MRAFAAFLALAAVLASGAGLLISGIAPYVGWSAFLMVVCVFGAFGSLGAALVAYDKTPVKKLSRKETQALKAKLTASLKSRQVLVLPPAEDPRPDDLSDYVPDGQGELSRDLMRLMQDQVEEAASRWDAIRSPLPKYRWHMSPEWHAEFLKLRQPPGEPVDVSEEYGVPELVTAPEPEPETLTLTAEQRRKWSMSLLDEAVRSYREKTILGVLPEDQAEAAGLLEQYDRARRMRVNLASKPLIGENAVMYTGLGDELDAVRGRLKALRDRYEAVKAVEVREVSAWPEDFATATALLDRRLKELHGVPPMVTAPLSSAGGTREVPHRCNGKYYANVAYCPQHGR